jgi:hypothetical protein
MKTPIFGAWLYWLAAVSAFAQSTNAVDPPDLVHRREELLRNLQRASVPIYEAYLKSLEPLKTQYAREGNLGAITALQNEIKRVEDELDKAARAAARGDAVMLGFTILSASFGAHEKHRTIDTTEILREALREGKKTLRLDTKDGAGGKDPAPFVPKETVVTYSFEGERKQKTFKEGYNLNFETDLK